MGWKKGRGEKNIFFFECTVYTYIYIYTVFSFAPVPSMYSIYACILSVFCIYIYIFIIYYGNVWTLHVNYSNFVDSQAGCA